MFFHFSGQLYWILCPRAVSSPRAVSNPRAVSRTRAVPGQSRAVPGQFPGSPRAYPGQFPGSLGQSRAVISRTHTMWKQWCWLLPVRRRIKYMRRRSERWECELPWWWNRNFRWRNRREWKVNRMFKLNDLTILRLLQKLLQCHYFIYNEKKMFVYFNNLLRKLPNNSNKSTIIIWVISISTRMLYNNNKNYNYIYIYIQYQKYILKQQI